MIIDILNFIFVICLISFGISAYNVGETVSSSDQNINFSNTEINYAIIINSTKYRRTRYKLFTKRFKTTITSIYSS